MSKKETKERYALALLPSQVKAIDELAKEQETSRAQLYSEGGQLLLDKYGKTVEHKKDE
jgi:hypothetical protein